MLLLNNVHWQEMQFAVPNPWRGSNKIRKIGHSPYRAAQDRYFQAIIVIHMYMHGG